MGAKAIAFVLALNGPLAAFPLELTSKWKAEVPGVSFHNHPVLTRNFVLMTSRGEDAGAPDEADGLYIIDSSTGERVHIRTPNDAGGIALADMDGDRLPEVLVGCWDGSVYIYSIEAEISRPLRLDTGYIVASTPTVSDVDGDGRPEILAANSQGHLSCFEPDGSLLWRYEEPAAAWVLSTPAVADLDGDGSPEVVVGNGTPAATEGSLYCFDARGRLLWKFPTEGQVLSSPAVGDIDRDGSPEISFGSWDHNLYCLGPDGTERWRFSTGGRISSSPALADVSPEEGTEIIFGSMDNTVHCLSSEGGEIWAFRTEGPVISSPAVADLDGDGRPEVVVGDTAGTVYVLSSSGVPLWKFKAESSILSSPAVGDADGDGNLEVVVPSREAVYCFEAPASGRVAWAKFHGDSWNTGFLFNAITYGQFSSRGFPGTWAPSIVPVRVPKLKLEPQALDFGRVAVGDTSLGNIEISNVGTDTLVVTGMIVGGPTADVSPTAPSGFGLLTDPPLRPWKLPPGEGRTVILFFAPRRHGFHRAALQVSSNDPESPHSVPLTGIGVAPNLEPSAEALDFGDVQLGAHKDTSLSIYNRGNAPLEISRATLASGEAFELLHDIGGSTVPPGGGIGLRIRFLPLRLGRFEDALIVRTNDPENPELSVPLTGTGVDTVPPTVECSPPPTGFKMASGQSFEVRITARDPSGIDSAMFCYRLGGERKFTYRKMSGDTVFTATLSPTTRILHRGLELYIKVVDGAGNIWQSPHYTIAGKIAGKGIKRPGLTLRKKYQMISLPMYPEDPSPSAVLGDILGPYDDTKWRLFWWDPRKKTYTECPDVPPFAPGRGYWLITRDPKELYTGPGVSVPPDTFEVTLQPGWNMIGCPFAFPVGWNEVEGHETLLPELPRACTVVDGKYEFPDQYVLRPWQGYAIYNPTGRTVTIKFPPLEAGTPKPGSTSLLDLAEASGGWAVRIVAENDEVRDAYNFLGWMPEASDTWDRYERAELPPLPGFVSLYFDHRSWPDFPGLHTTDVRPAGRKRYTWRFFVLAPEGKVRLSWRHTGLPEGLRGRIVDEGTGTWSELKPSGKYTFCSDGSVRAFELVIEPSGPTPEGYRLSASPNPFNSSVSIVAEVPEPGFELAVYDVRGRRVRTLARGVPPGRYVLSWDGRDDEGRPAGSGVYILRLGEVSCKLALIR